MLSKQNEIKLIELFKVCTECKIPKLLSEFYKRKIYRFGVRPVCKTCYKAYTNIQHKVYYKKHRERLKAYSRIHYATNREKNKAYCKIYRKKHKAETKIYNKKYRQINKEKTRIYDRERHRTDPKIKLSNNISNRVCQSLKGNKNGRHWEDIVGYTLDKLKKHLEKKFTKGMSWNNYGQWHIDHEVPVSAFNFTKPEHRDFKRCWALKNLQPLWAEENQSKNAKIDKHFQPSLLI